VCRGARRARALPPRRRCTPAPPPAQARDVKLVSPDGTGAEKRCGGAEKRTQHRSTRV
jgi:hypothetical protein